MAEAARAARARRRRSRRRRLIAAGTGVVAVGVGGAVALAETTASAAALRTAVVDRESITAVVEASGTVSAAAKATPSFAVSGTVASVAVALDQAVRKGQLLARVDTSALQASVDQAQASLAQAQQRLQADETGQASAASNSTASNSTASNSTANGSAPATTSITPLARSGSGTAPKATGLSALVVRIQEAQRAVVAAQRALDGNQAAIDTAQRTVDADVTHDVALRDAQATACTTAPDGSTGPTTDACTNAQADYQHIADTLAADGASLDAAIAAQDRTLHQLDAALRGLDALLAALPKAAAAADSTGSTAGSTGQPKSSTTSTGTSPSSSTTTTASASQLAADQAQIDAATAQLHEARQNLAAATLRSPITGRVAAVGLTAGQLSTGGSITIVGAGTPTVATEVPLAQIGQVRVGQRASVAVDGVSHALHGTVTSIGLLSTTSGSTTTFPVTIQLDPTGSMLFDGAGADVRITTGAVHDVLAVPNSAIHTGLRGTHTVTVVRGTHASTVPVTLGVAGADVTEVRSGLTAGQQVELADDARAVPSGSVSNRFARLLSGGGNAFVFPGAAGGGG